MKKVLKGFGIFVAISFAICLALGFYSVLSNPEKYQSNGTNNEEVVDEQSKEFNYDKADNFKYVTEALTTIIGESPNFKWTAMKDWVDEDSQVQYFTGYIQNFEVDVPYKFRFAGSDCVHFTFNSETIISDIDKEVEWMDSHNND